MPLPQTVLQDIKKTSKKVCSLGCKNLLNFTRNTIKFHNTLYATENPLSNVAINGHIVSFLH